MLAKNELITDVRIPPQGESRTRLYQGHRRLGRRLAGARRRGVRLPPKAATRQSARIVVSAATEKATRLTGAEQVLLGAAANDKTLATGADAAADEAEIIADLRGSASYKRELLRVYAARAVRAALAEHRGGAMTTTGISGGQVGRSLPRLEAREKVTGRAEYTHHLRLPGMLYAKMFRSTVAHGRILSIDTEAARAMPGVYAVIPARTSARSSPIPITDRPSTTSRSSRSARCVTSASRSPWCSPAIRTSPSRRRS